MSNRNVYAVIPAFNEGGAISPVVRETLRHVSCVIVVDDASTDETATIALEAGAVVLRHAVNLGQGAALQTGITQALHSGAAYIATIDADGQHEPAQIPLLLDQMIAARADVALGSRFKGETIGMSRLRYVVLKCAVVFTRLTTGLELTDSHNGFRIFSAAAARRLRIRQNRMAHASEILEEISRLKISYIEVPVTVRYSEYSNAKGQSSWNSLNILLDMAIRWVRK